MTEHACVSAETASRVDVRADPRISNLRPAWLTDDQGWREQLQAMSREDADWVERQWEMADGAPAAVDTSWITFEKAGAPRWWWVPLAAVLAWAGFLVAWVVT